MTWKRLHVVAWSFIRGERYEWVLPIMRCIGMTEGDRVVYKIDGRHGVAGEFLQDGDCQVTFDDGSTKMVKWNNLRKE